MALWIVRGPPPHRMPIRSAPNTTPSISSHAIPISSSHSPPQDFSCINQDQASPGDELSLLMVACVSMCDVLLTPIHDPEHWKWELPVSIIDAFKVTPHYIARVSPSHYTLHSQQDYQAPAWHVYWQRAWCRVEAFLAAAVPLTIDGRFRQFRAGLRARLQCNERPHLIFGTKELEESRPSLIMPALDYARLDDYHPRLGMLHDETDREHTDRLVAVIYSQAAELLSQQGATLDQEGASSGSPGVTGAAVSTILRSVAPTIARSVAAGSGVVSAASGARPPQCGVEMFETSFVSKKGEEIDHHPDGEGSVAFSNGNYYVGAIRTSKFHGQGVLTWEWGDVYDGGWKNGKMHGLGRHTFADGGRFQGRFRNGKREGYGTFQYAITGERFVGYYKADLKDRGVLMRQNGEVLLSRWSFAQGRPLMVGVGVKWSATRKEAYMLRDGEEQRKIKEAHAQLIAWRLGFKKPARPELTKKSRFLPMIEMSKGVPQAGDMWLRRDSSPRRSSRKMRGSEAGLTTIMRVSQQVAGEVLHSPRANHRPGSCSCTCPRPMQRSESAPSLGEHLPVGTFVRHDKHGVGRVVEAQNASQRKDGVKVVRFDALGGDGETHRYRPRSHHKLQPITQEAFDKAKLECRSGESGRRGLSFKGSLASRGFQRRSSHG